MFKSIECSLKGHGFAPFEGYSCQVLFRTIVQFLTQLQYREHKSTLTEEKLTFKQEMAALEKNRIGWFEPATRFLKAVNQAVFLTSSNDGLQKRDFLRKFGSNLTVYNKTLRVELREPLKTLADHGRLAQDTSAPQIRGALVHGESDRSAMKRRR